MSLQKENEVRDRGTKSKNSNSKTKSQPASEEKPKELNDAIEFPKIKVVGKQVDSFSYLTTIWTFDLLFFAMHLGMGIKEQFTQFDYRKLVLNWSLWYGLMVGVCLLALKTRKRLNGALCFILQITVYMRLLLFTLGAAQTGSFLFSLYPRLFGSQASSLNQQVSAEEIKNYYTRFATSAGLALFSLLNIYLTYLMNIAHSFVETKLRV